MSHHPRRSCLALLCCMGLLAATAFAATPNRRPQPVLPDQLQTDATALAVRVRLDQLDMERFRQRANEVLGPEIEPFEKPISWLEKAHAAFTGAGVTELIFGLREDDQHRREQPFLAFRLARNKTPMDVKRALEELGGPSPDEDDVVWSEQGRWLIAESDEVREQPFTHNPERGRLFARAFRQMRGLPVSAVVVLPPKVRAEGIREVGQVRRDGMISEADFKLITNVISADFLSAGIDPGDTFRAILQIRAASAADARAIVEALEQDKEPDLFPDEKVQPMNVLLVTLAGGEVSANRAMVRAEFDWDRARTSIDQITGMLFDARQQAQAVLSMNNMKQIVLAMHLHSMDHGGLPDGLEQLKPYLGEEEAFQRVLTHPRTGVFPGYAYTKPADAFSDLPSPATTVVLWELKDGKPDPDGFKGYADGHVAR